MGWFTTRPGSEAQHVVDGFDWGSLGVGTVVDVGGSHGANSVAIARKFPMLLCIVENKPEVVKAVQYNLPTDLEDRVEFKGHDFSTEQPVKEAEVYLLGWILHDWSDEMRS